VYTTTEPCVMCFGACHWTHVARIVYGTSVADSSTLGFSELGIANLTLRELGGSAVELVGGALRDECLAIFTAWKERGKKELY
jgi:tRNA(Arg) A34 adenosine deaminase TadA